MNECKRQKILEKVRHRQELARWVEQGDEAAIIEMTILMGMATREDFEVREDEECREDQ